MDAHRRNRCPRRPRFRFNLSGKRATDCEHRGNFKIAPLKFDHYSGLGVSISSDNGKTWDLDHRYLLATWRGIIKGDLEHNACQSTSTVLLPGGEILTAFGTGFRNADPNIYNMEAGMVKWAVSDKSTNTDHFMADAPFDSDFRNIFDPGSPE